MLSRAEISRLAHLNKPTISNLVAGLIDDGIVQEVGAGTSTGGRRPVLLTVRGASRLTVGVEIDAASCRLLLVTLKGERVAMSDIPLASTEVGAVANAITDGIDALLAGRDRATLLGCGVAVPGMVDPARQMVDSAPRLGWESVPFSTLLRERLGVPVLLADRGKAAGLGELWVLGKDHAEDLIYLYLGRGVAGAIVLRHEIVWGTGNTAGEFGHLTVVPDGPPCVCGNHGCLEALVSTSAIISRARHALSQCSDSPLAQTFRSSEDDQALIRAIGRAAVDDDPVATDVVGETGRWLGIAIANLVNALNPAVVVLGGPTAEWGQILTMPVERELGRRALPRSRRAARIVIGHARDLAAPLGGAALVLQRASTILAGFKSVGTADIPVAQAATCLVPVAGASGHMYGG